jgi:hypothetical protein
LLKKSFLYIVLWLSGCIIAGIIIVMWNAPVKSRDAISLFGINAPELVGNNNESGNIVNELLLSASELNISGETNLIGLNNKGNSYTGLLLSREMKSNPENVYHRILKQKLEKINTRSDGDFYIKAVPK